MIEMNLSKLHESIKSGYVKFTDLLAELSCEELTQPGVIATWSVKDMTAHICVHEQRIVQWMKERLQGNEPRSPQPYDMPADELDRLNEQIFEENRNRAWDDILYNLEEAHIEVLKLLETSTGEDILNTERLQLQGGEPLWEAIAANTVWHYEEHGEDIRRWQETNQIMDTSSINTEME
jgi:hypothetical protein